MESWLRSLTRIHHYTYPIVAVCGLLATVTLSEPGAHVAAVGPVRFDPFYASLVAFGALLLLSVTDAYDPSDYGLGSSDGEE
ncbi:hypothetical protein [Halobaculum lipolyticum]|uniref:Uncharacterized protein n=1 Tax=Halobaculum lipolyticum TaxID=3032001 RepID=A0ABD5WBY8_9EURY|nr:hypothetical protein [Halobaculum sp. DT31]